MAHSTGRLASALHPKLMLLLLLYGLAGLAAPVPPPASPCDFDGFDTHAKMAEMKTSGTAYYACAAGKCLPMPMKPGDPVVIARSEAGWTCGYLTTPKGAAQGWARSQDLRPVDSVADPPPTAWLGTWAQDENRLTIRVSANPAKLALQGEAYWHGRGDNVHSGSIDGVATPVANHLHYEEDGPGACAIDFTLLGNYLLANDNNMCGGMNVRFWGVWRRRTPGK